MARVIEYRVLVHALDEASPTPPLIALARDVNELLQSDQGWEPLGGVLCVMGTFAGSDRALWCQSMIRRTR